MLLPLVLMTLVDGSTNPPWSFVGTADGGKTWTKVPTPAGCSIINAIDFDAAQKSVFAQCDSGLYRAVSP